MHTFYSDAPMVGMAEVTFGNLQDAILHAQKKPSHTQRQGTPKVGMQFSCIKNQSENTPSVSNSAGDLLEVVKT